MLGGLPSSDERRDGDHDLVGDCLPVAYGSYVVSGGMIGALSVRLFPRDIDEVTVGWYCLRGVVGLESLVLAFSGSPTPSFFPPKS
jgi:hypothetical protein